MFYDIDTGNAAGDSNYSGGGELLKSSAAEVMEAVGDQAAPKTPAQAKQDQSQAVENTNEDGLKSNTPAIEEGLPNTEGCNDCVAVALRQAIYDATGVDTGDLTDEFNAYLVELYNDKLYDIKVKGCIPSLDMLNTIAGPWDVEIDEIHYTSDSALNQELGLDPVLVCVEKSPTRHLITIRKYETDNGIWYFVTNPLSRGGRSPLTYESLFWWSQVR